MNAEQRKEMCQTIRNVGTGLIVLGTLAEASSDDKFLWQTWGVLNENAKSLGQLLSGPIVQAEEQTPDEPEPEPVHDDDN